MVEPFGSGLWLFDGAPIVAALGFHYPTRMAIMRRATGGLLIWSPIALSDELLAEVTQIGTVEALIAPNSLHHVYLNDWIRAYPKAKVIGAPGLAAKRNDLRFDVTIDTTSTSIWPEDIAHVIIDTRITSEVVVFHRPSGTVLFTDLLQQMPPNWYSGWRALIARMDLMTAPEPSVPRKFRMAIADRSAAKSALEQVLEWPIKQVVMAHGTPVTDDANAFLRRAFAWLM